MNRTLFMCVAHQALVGWQKVWRVLWRNRASTFQGTAR
jgi:hypothetical protein